MYVFLTYTVIVAYIPWPTLTRTFDPFSKWLISVGEASWDLRRRRSVGRSDRQTDRETGRQGLAPSELETDWQADWGFRERARTRIHLFPYDVYTT